MTDVHDTIRTALAAELDAWAVLAGLSWSVDELPPGTGVTDTGESATTLPNASVWFADAIGQRSQLQPAGWDSEGRVTWRKGRFEGAFMAKVWCGNATDYKAARAAFELAQLERAILTGDERSLCHELTPEVYGIDASVRVFWDGKVTFADPNATGRRNFWEITWTGILSYPDWVQETATTGLLAMDVEVNDEGHVHIADLDDDAPASNQWVVPSVGWVVLPFVHGVGPAYSNGYDSGYAAAEVA